MFALLLYQPLNSHIRFISSYARKYHKEQLSHTNNYCFKYLGLNGILENHQTDILLTFKYVTYFIKFTNQKAYIIFIQTMLDTIFFKALALGSIITLGTPLDVLKVRMQTNAQLLALGRISEQYRSFMNCFETILKNEGLSGLWKGNTMTMIRVLPIQAINYYTRKTLQKHFNNKLSNNILISMVSGITATTILYPTDVLRQFLNNNISGRLSLLAASRKILSQYGFKYFFKGYPNLLVTTILYRGCYNGFYDTHKVNTTQKERVIVAYLSAIIGEYIVYPIQTVRRRRIIMNAKETFFTYARSIWKKEGFKGFYKAASVVPFQSITWAFVLILFDTAGIGFQVSFQG